MAGSAGEFVAAKLVERDNRLKRSGNGSRYLVEPNVKESKGGLRDLNTLFWIGKYVYRVKEAKDLVDAGLFSPEEFALFSRCEEFLWRIRCHMHFIAGRAEERLSFDMQRLVAERLKVVSRARPLRHRALHEALFPHRQGCRRPHRHRLRRDGSARDHAAPAARPLSRAFPPQAHPRARSAGLRRLERALDALLGRMSSRRIRSTSSASSGLPTSTTSPSIPRPSTSSPDR